MESVSKLEAVDKETETSRLILLVEDDADVAFLLQRTFSRHFPQWRFKHAADGVAAVDHILSHGPPAVVITDLQMPAMNGYELIAWMRTQPGTPRCPIYVMSGSLDAEVVKRCRDLGADDFIPKQCCPDELNVILRRLFH